MKNLSSFLNDEAGAVTVDWVVLTAAIVGFGLLVFNLIRPAVANMAQGISNELANAENCLLIDTSISC